MFVERTFSKGVIICFVVIMGDIGTGVECEFDTAALGVDLIVSQEDIMFFDFGIVWELQGGGKMGLHNLGMIGAMNVPSEDLCIYLGNGG